MNIANPFNVTLRCVAGYYIPRRCIQVSVIGAYSAIGTKLALLLKKNPKLSRIHLFDKDDRVRGIGVELALTFPDEPTVSTFYGEDQLPYAIHGSDLILMVARTPRTAGKTRAHMLAANALPVQQLCKVIADRNRHAFFAISTNPINSILPMACSLMFKYNCFNPYKIFGITHIDTMRTKSITGMALKTDPKEINVPVIGGHSENTIVPLFSNMRPVSYTVDQPKADLLTRVVRRAGTNVMGMKQGIDSSTTAMAYSIAEFTDSIADAIDGQKVVVNCYSATPKFGAKYFSAPTVVGEYGIVELNTDFTMNPSERALLRTAVIAINDDVARGEEHVRVMESTTRFS